VNLDVTTFLINTFTNYMEPKPTLTMKEWHKRHAQTTSGIWILFKQDADKHFVISR
jgi:hypothetical protein